MIPIGSVRPAEQADSSEVRFAFSLSGGLQAGGEARRAVIEGDGALPDTARYDVLLLVTELVTNAVTHGGVGPEQELSVELHIWPGRVRVTVSDVGKSFTWVRRRMSRADSDGWGLLLVDRLADRWGVKRAPSGTCVWFEMAYKE